MFRFSSFFILCVLCVSCSYFKPVAKPEAIARVDEAYLYKEDIKELVPLGTSKEDSVAIVQNYINRWASQKLLINAAELNLNDTKQAEFNELVKQYKIDLYTKAYIEELVKREVDTTISEAEIKEYYAENKQNFKTNRPLVRLRYIKLQKDNPKLAIIKNKFFNFKSSDKKFWDTMALQFKSFAFNDTIWVDVPRISEKLPFITIENRDKYIVAGKQMEQVDSLDLYLVKITSVMGSNQISPLQVIRPMLRQVLLNKRKLELIHKFEKEITDDAIKNNKYEIYK